MNGVGFGDHIRDPVDGLLQVQIGVAQPVPPFESLPESAST
jgi:hypothetical protein